MDETFSTVLYVVIFAGLAVVLLYAGRQFVAGLQEAKREHDARLRAQQVPPSSASQIVRRRGE